MTRWFLLLGLASGASFASDGLPDKRTPLPMLGPAPQAERVITCSDRVDAAALAKLAAVVEVGPVAVEGGVGRRLMIVLRTNGCHFDRGKLGCTMCDFMRHAIDPKVYRVTAEDLSAQLEDVLAHHPGAKGPVHQIDLLTLGSFLNPGEVPLAYWDEAMKKVSAIPTVKRVIVEGRAPFIKTEAIERLRLALRSDIELQVSIGVESSNEKIRNEIIKKELDWKELGVAMDTVAAFRDRRVTFQTYLLIKPQGLSEREAIEDSIQSARDIAREAKARRVPTRIAFEPVFVTQGTALDVEYQAGRYRPPNLWSVVEVIQRTHASPEFRDNPYITGIYVGLSDEGLSQGRVAGSCPTCEKKLVLAIQAYNGDQNAEALASLTCSCRPAAEGPGKKLSFTVLPDEMAVCHLPAGVTLAEKPPGEFRLVLESSDDTTVVCHASRPPAGAEVSSGWRALKLQGEWAFSEVGVLAEITALLRCRGIPVMAYSFFKTDYVLVSKENLAEALQALRDGGHLITLP